MQLLEAASVLVAMNADPIAGTEARDQSDNSSASPAASGSSGYREDDVSSADTTPPPADAVESGKNSDLSRAFSSASSNGLSQSYGSSCGTNGHRRRPRTSGSVSFNYEPSEEQADLAAAVGLLSCSYGTPASNPMSMPSDVPPVPPLPAKFLGQQAQLFPTSFPAAAPRYSYERGNPDKDVEMRDEKESQADESDSYSASRARSEDDDEGVFGGMDE